ncbi:oxygen regulatory protein NreC [Puia dinghuensis]|uniref:Oxygen regulatory protein NreC n=2 Tax=Puia dinghuensis TaxID=1792502 RepID=A0A8J2UBC2_9BACT|nr:oxygen regulatory protein NreC [Puia dinghuensis]
MSVFIQVSETHTLLDRLRETSVDVLLMDLFMPGLSGVDAVKAVLNEVPGIKIVVLSMNVNIKLINMLLDVGVYGYVSKSDEPEEMLHAIRSAAGGRIYRNKWFTEALYWSKQANINGCLNDEVDILNEREKKILQMIWEEKSNKEISEDLFIGIRSVEKIRQDMKEKTGVQSTVGLLKYGLNKMIIDPPFVEMGSYQGKSL